jgi:hypothetical protein
MHPDPALFTAGLDTAPQKIGVTPGGVAGGSVGGAVDGGNGSDVGGAASGGAATSVSEATSPVAGPGSSSGGNTPFPADLAAPGWKTGAVSHFDNSNLYVKIDGREDYYKSFGFQQLHWVSLVSDRDAATTVDVELFDLGKAANALGAYAGERAPDAAPQIDGTGMWHRARNATFVTIGRYYARLVGSDESEAVLAQLEQARKALTAALPGEPLPWGYALFVGGMGLDPGRVAYVPENAYSFGFARGVYTGRLNDADLEGFVVASVDPGAAAQLAQRFSGGFREYGEDAGGTWVRDRYLGTLSGVRAHGAWVAGVRGATDPKQAGEALTRLETAVGKLTPEIAARAQAEAKAAAAEASTSETNAGSAEPGTDAEPR